MSEKRAGNNEQARTNAVYYVGWLVSVLVIVRVTKRRACGAFSDEQETTTAVSFSELLLRFIPDL